MHSQWRIVIANKLEKSDKQKFCSPLKLISQESIMKGI